MIWVIRNSRLGDQRGWFTESFSQRRFDEAGISTRFVQDNHSLSRDVGTLRGLHFQTPPFAQVKLVRCLRGRILDVFVDVRRGSPTYGKWGSIELSSARDEQVLIPQGYAHGFLTLEPDSEIFYKVSDFYTPKNDAGLRWNDPDIGVVWSGQVDIDLISEKDAKLPLLRDFESPFPYDGKPLELRVLEP